MVDSFVCISDLIASPWRFDTPILRWAISSSCSLRFIFLATAPTSFATEGMSVLSSLAICAVSESISFSCCSRSLVVVRSCSSTDSLIFCTPAISFLILIRISELREFLREYKQAEPD